MLVIIFCFYYCLIDWFSVRFDYLIYFLFSILMILFFSLFPPLPLLLFLSSSSSRLSSDDTYVAMLMNDEVHTYDEVSEREREKRNQESEWRWKTDQSSSEYVSLLVINGY